MGCGVCGAFPFIAGQTTTIINMGIIYTSSPIFIIFPVAELEALGRKEILIFIALVISINLYFKFIYSLLINKKLCGSWL